MESAYTLLKKSMRDAAKAAGAVLDNVINLPDTPDNVAFFAEYLLLGTTDEEFVNVDDPNEYDIRNAELFPRWIPEENLK